MQNLKIYFIKNISEKFLLINKKNREILCKTKNSPLRKLIFIRNSSSMDNKSNSVGEKNTFFFNLFFLMKFLFISIIIC